MKFIPVYKPYLGRDEANLLQETITDNWITGGKKVKEFESKIAFLSNAKYAIACMNGTLALYMGLAAMGIKNGDEVIVPDFTFIASANAVILAGGKPVFCDIDKDTFNISVMSILRKVGQSTKAIMPVHIYGKAADMDKVLIIANDCNLGVIEDAAQGVGVKYKNKPVGTLGDVGIHSYYSDKTLTTGEGGMVLTNNPEMADKALMLKHQGRRQRGIYLHESIGFNFRMTDMQAAVGLAQLSKLGYIIKRKLEIEHRYEMNLQGIVDLPVHDDGHVPFRINILVENPQGMTDYLMSKAIGTMRFFYPLHRQPCFKYMNLKDEDYPNSIWAYEHGISLPSWVEISDEQIDYVCENVKSYKG